MGWGILGILTISSCCLLVSHSSPQTLESSITVLNSPLPPEAVVKPPSLLTQPQDAPTAIHPSLVTAFAILPVLLKPRVSILSVGMDLKSQLTKERSQVRF